MYMFKSWLNLYPPIHFHLAVAYAEHSRMAGDPDKLPCTEIYIIDGHKCILILLTHQYNSTFIQAGVVRKRQEGVQNREGGGLGCMEVH
jgi:hypothetical protein